MADSKDEPKFIAAHAEIDGVTFVASTKSHDKNMVSFISWSSQFRLVLQCTELEGKYKIKIVSPHNKDGPEVQDWHVTSRFCGIDQMEMQLKEDFKKVIQDDEFVYGYISPGHGTKGHQISINCDGDLTAMYNAYRKKKQILEWLKVICKKLMKPVKCPCVSTDVTEIKKSWTIGGTWSNHENHLCKMSEVEVIKRTLRRAMLMGTTHQKI